MSEWHKIETAPKDGTDILLWRSRTRFGREVNPPIVAGWFSNGDEAGWSSHEQPDKWIDGEPTYWMPLPDPPRDHP